MTQALYRKWRPQGWDQVTAQDHVIQTIKNAVVNQRVAHAYLFAGPRGTGKTTTARLLAKAVNCLDPELANRPCNACEHCLSLNAGRFLDLIEIDAASNTSVDDVRDLRDKINFSPSQGRYKVYIIDEVHMLSTAAFNALLKTLEEPPPHAIFVLATTEIHKIPATVLSRCQRHEFRRIPFKEIVAYLKDKSQEENILVDEPVLSEIARQATGSLRDAISLLDQLTSTGEHVTLDQAQAILGTATSLRVIEVVSALVEKDSANGLTLINDALDSGTDPRQFSRQIVTYLRNIMLFKMGNKNQVEAGQAVEEKLAEHAEQFSMPALLTAIESFNEATSQEGANWHPGLGLELAFTTFLSEPAIPSANQAISEEPAPVKTIQHPPEPKPEARKTVVEKAPQTPISQRSPTGKPVKQKPVPQKDEQTAVPEPLADEDTFSTLPGEEITLNEVKRAWGKIKAMVKKHNPRTEGLLNTSKLAGIKDNTLILGFSSDTLKGMMEKEGNITLTADILEEVFGQPLQVKCIVTSHDSSSIPENLQIDKDGMVGTATRDLGGKISSATEEKSSSDKS
jgi:DNA polymerase III subunit gamma/tau